MSYIRVFIVLLEGVVDVQHGQMVPVDVSETHLGLVRLFLRLNRAHKDLRDCTMIRANNPRWMPGRAGTSGREEQRKRTEVGHHISRLPKKWEAHASAVRFSNVRDISNTQQVSRCPTNVRANARVTDNTKLKLRKIFSSARPT